VAAVIFEIIAIVAMILAVLIAIFILPFLARFLKRTNKSMADRARGVRDQVTTSLGGMETAQAELESFAAMTSGAKAAMTGAIATADKAVQFLESRTFQIGLPLAFIFGLLAVAVPRGRRNPHPRKRRTVIPPPSWEAEEDSGQ
jgi:UDP-N-acetylmuramyl pentapeptide phosphotransferase/UDP-N-acetylglucosamine-1-phosphate transferase